MTHIVCILAAGRGTRMAPATDFTPKALLPFAGVPLLARNIELAASTEPAAIYVNAFHHHEQLESFVASYACNLPLRCVPERRLLGTAGGVRELVACATEDGVEFNDVLVINADILTTAPLQVLLAALHGEDPEQAALLTLSAEHAEGNITLRRETAGNAEARHFVTSLPGDAGETHISPLAGEAEQPEDTLPASFGGIFAMRRALIESYPRNQIGCLIRNVLGPALGEGKALRALPTESFWSDLGTPARWMHAVETLQRDSQTLRQLPGQSLPQSMDASYTEVVDKAPQTVTLVGDRNDGRRLTFIGRDAAN